MKETVQQYPCHFFLSLYLQTILACKMFHISFHQKTPETFCIPPGAHKPQFSLVMYMVQYPEYEVFHVSVDRGLGREA